MRFRARSNTKYGTRISINGTPYEIDAKGFLTILDTRDAHKVATALKDEFAAVLPEKEELLSVPEPTRTAMEFVALYRADIRMQAKYNRMSSPEQKEAFARSLGFSFTEAELAAAIAAQLPGVPVEATADATPIPEPVVAEVLAAAEPAKPDVLAEPKEWKVPGEGEDWPDPDPAMPLAYLQQMATAYEVKWDLRTSARKLVTRIRAAMYPG